MEKRKIADLIVDEVGSLVLDVPLEPRGLALLALEPQRLEELGEALRFGALVGPLVDVFAVAARGRRVRIVVLVVGHARIDCVPPLLYFRQLAEAALRVVRYVERVVSVGKHLILSI